MLYPNLDELISLKNRKAGANPKPFHSVKSTVPGNHHSPFRGQGLEFDTVREYVPGDDIRSIDWKVTARTGSPHLKLFREEKERSVILCVDMNGAMRFGTRNTFKSVQAARAAAILGWHALANHDRTGACLFGDVPEGMQFFAPQRTRKSLWSMLKMTAKPPQEHHIIPLDQALKHLAKAVHTGALIYIISDFMSITEELEHILNRLNKRCDVVAIAINDPAERSIPPVNTIFFQGGDSEKIFVNTDSSEGRKAYALQWEANRKKLKEVFSRQKISMIAMSTETDVSKELLFGLKKIAKRRLR